MELQAVCALIYINEGVGRSVRYFDLFVACIVFCSIFAVQYRNGIDIVKTY